MESGFQRDLHAMVPWLTTTKKRWETNCVGCVLRFAVSQMSPGAANAVFSPSIPFLQSLG